MLTFEVGGASGVAQAVSERLPQNTTRTSRELYRVLVTIAIEATRRRGHSPNTTEAIFHLPVELLAEATGISRVTAWRHLPELRALGLVDHRTHKAACRGQTRNSGTVWRVRLSPLQGSRARVSADDLRHKWRGREMRTAASFRVLKRTKELQRQSSKIELCISWALSPSNSQNLVVPVSFTPPQMRLENLLDVTGADRKRRAEAVDLAAQALAQSLRDASSLNWYRKLLWQLLRRVDAGGADESHRLFLAAQRAAVDAREWQGLRRPGALLQSRLRAAEWFAEMMAAPPVRVGPRPIGVLG